MASKRIRWKGSMKTRGIYLLWEGTVNGEGRFSIEQFVGFCYLQAITGNPPYEAFAYSTIEDAKQAVKEFLKDGKELKGNTEDPFGELPQLVEDVQNLLDELKSGKYGKQDDIQGDCRE